MTARLPACQARRVRLLGKRKCGLVKLLELLDHAADLTVGGIFGTEAEEVTTPKSA